MYSGSERSAEEILKRVSDRFGINISLVKNNLQFVKIEKHVEMNPALYPRLTMVW